MRELKFNILMLLAKIFQFISSHMNVALKITGNQHAVPKPSHNKCHRSICGEGGGLHNGT